MKPEAGLNRRTKVVIVGASGQAREVASYIQDLNDAGAQYDLLGFVVTDLTKLGSNDSADRVLGNYDWLRARRGQVDALILGIGAPKARLKVAAELEAEFPETAWPSIVHPSAKVDLRSLHIGKGVLIGPGAIVTVNVRLEDFSMLNFGCTVGHEARVGPGCVVNPGANVSGGVVLEEGVMLGAGAVVLQYRTVGAGASVGAGAVVTRDVPPGVTAVGVPARAMAGTKR